MLKENNVCVYVEMKLYKPLLKKMFVSDKVGKIHKPLCWKKMSKPLC